MAVTQAELKTGRKVSIQEGQKLVNEGVYVVFRPEDLPEDQQFAIAMWE